MVNFLLIIIIFQTIISDEKGFVKWFLKPYTFKVDKVIIPNKYLICIIDKFIKFSEKY